MEDLQYYYEMPHKTEDKVLVITPYGVSVEYADGSVMHTNIVPMTLFAGCDSLNREQRMRIARTAVEGKMYSAKELKKLYKLWKRFGEP